MLNVFNMKNEARGSVNMKIVKKLDETRAMNVWIDELPYQYKLANKQLLYYKGNKSLEFYEGTISLEVKLNPRHISNYAMIAMTYSCGDNDELLVEMVSKDTLEEKYDSEILEGRKKILGIHSEYVDGMIHVFNQLDETELPTGKITILGGGYDEISSSMGAFERVMAILLLLFRRFRKKDAIAFDDEVYKEITNICSGSYGDMKW